jgi:hypothetical protein
MTRARIINAIIWVAILVAILVSVLTEEWCKQSTIAAVLIYTCMCAGLAGIIDTTIKEHENR